MAASKIAITSPIGTGDFRFVISIIWDGYRQRQQVVRITEVAKVTVKAPTAHLKHDLVYDVQALGLPSFQPDKAQDTQLASMRSGLSDIPGRVKPCARRSAH
jgi:hypothetical protein